MLTILQAATGFRPTVQTSPLPLGGTDLVRTHDMAGNPINALQGWDCCGAFQLPSHTPPARLPMRTSPWHCRPELELQPHPSICGTRNRAAPEPALHPEVLRTSLRGRLSLTV